MSCNCFDLIEREYLRLLGSKPIKQSGRRRPLPGS
jgi:hypothetical protein